MTHNLFSQHNHVSYTGVKTYSSTYSYLLLHILGKKIVTSSLVSGALMFYGSAWLARDSFHDMCVVKRLAEAISISGAHGEKWSGRIIFELLARSQFLLEMENIYIEREL